MDEAGTMNIAIIPASSTSKRLPGKNTLPVNGKPMISYPIEAAKASGLFDQIIVSSKDDEISTIAKDLGCQVFPAPASLRRETSTCALVCHSVLELLAHRGDGPEYFCCIHATAIGVSPEDIIESHKMLERTDFVMGIARFVYEPEHAMVEQNGFLEPVNRRALRYKARSFPAKFSSNGSMYWCRTKQFMAVRGFYGPRLTGYEIPKTRHVEINTIEDYKIACMLKNATPPALQTT